MENRKKKLKLVREGFGGNKMYCVECGKKFDLPNIYHGDADSAMCKDCEEQTITEIYDMEANYDDIDNWYNQYY